MPEVARSVEAIGALVAVCPISECVHQASVSGWFTFGGGGEEAGAGRWFLYNVGSGQSAANYLWVGCDGRLAWSFGTVWATSRDRDLIEAPGGEH